MARHLLLATGLTAIAVLAVAQPASAATPIPPPPPGFAVTHMTTDTTFSRWNVGPFNTSTGSRSKWWEVDLTAGSTDATGAVVRSKSLSVFACVDYFDHNDQLVKETCTRGTVTSGFGYTFQAAGVTGATVRAFGIPAQTCSTDAFNQPIGQCKPAAPINVKVAWTGTGPITYSTFRQYTPGVYFDLNKSQDRNADASGTFDGKTLRGQGFASLQAQVDTTWGNPCGTPSSQVHPDGC